MTDRPDHATVERTFLDLLDSQGMPQPDEIAHWRDCVVFGWRDTKAIVVIDLDEFEPPGTLLNPDVLADAIETA
jgi:hypothetical protein